MNDLFYEIIMQSSVLITGFDSDKLQLLCNLFLTIFGLIDNPRLYVVDLAGQSSKFSRFSPAVFAPSEILDGLQSIHSDMCARLDGTHDTEKPIYIYIHNFDSIISRFYGKEKKEIMQIISDMVNRGRGANVHIIITAEKYNNPLFYDFSSRIIAGKTDKKTAQKYFGAVAQELTNFDCSDFGQSMVNLDGIIYKFGVPEMSENSIDDILPELTGIADNAPVCPDTAPTNSTNSTESVIQPSAHVIHPDFRQADPATDDNTVNIISRILYFVLTFISVLIDSISDIIADNFIVKFAVILSVLVLYALSLPVKILHSLSTVLDSSGRLVVFCMLYMSVCTISGLMG